LDTLAIYIHTINKHYPDLKIATCSFNQDGQYNDVLIVNEDLVFRFAKVQPAIETLRKEITVLKCIRDVITLQVPNPVYSHVSTDTIGDAFMGYPVILGVPLWRHNFEKISNAGVRERMAIQLAGFLHELHGIPPESIPVELENSDSSEKWADIYQRIRKSLFPHMRLEARTEVHRQYSLRS